MQGRAISAIIFAILVHGICFPQLEKIRVSVPLSLKSYLQLSDEQAERLAEVLSVYQSFMSLKQNQMHSAQMKAAVDPGAGSSRLVEEYQAAIVSRQTRTREQISKILSPRQFTKLKRLEGSRSDDPKQVLLAKQAVELNLINNDRSAMKQSYGGTIAIFSSDAAAEAETSNSQQPKKAISKRKPPSAPPP
jgi:hypothetical protein